MFTEDEWKRYEEGIEDGKRFLKEIAEKNFIEKYPNGDNKHKIMYVRGWVNSISDFMGDRYKERHPDYGDH